MPLGSIAAAAGLHPVRSSARQIVLVCFLLVLVSVNSWNAPPAKAIPGAEPQEVDSSGLSYYAHAHPYLKENWKILVKQIPGLESLRPASDQKALPMILMHTGMRVEEFFRNIVDLVAREDIGQQVLGPTGEILASQHHRYNYLILLSGNEIPPRYDEYRTDPQGNQTQPRGFHQGYAITAGFALKCIYFLPGMQSDSTFRYLGDQVLDSRDTYVVAFAQRPAHAKYWGTVISERGRVLILDQGIAWVDKSTFQILRIRTDLLAAHNDIGLGQQTTEVNFGEVHIADVATPLWLPSEASVYALYEGQAFRNEHRYTNYEHFHVSVQMGPPIAMNSRADSRLAPP